MADALKVLGQLAVPATTLSAVYTAPSQATVSSISFCNTSGSTITFRLSIAPGNAGDTLSQYIYYDLQIGAKDTFIATVGCTLASSDVIRAYADLTGLSISVFGVEVS